MIRASMCRDFVGRVQRANPSAQIIDGRRSPVAVDLMRMRGCIDHSRYEENVASVVVTASERKESEPDSVSPQPSLRCCACIRWTESRGPEPQPTALSWNRRARKVRQAPRKMPSSDWVFPQMGEPIIVPAFPGPLTAEIAAEPSIDQLEFFDEGRAFSPP